MSGNNIHRAFRLTYPLEKDLFLTLERPCLVRKVESGEAWFAGEIPPSHQQFGWDADLPSGIEVDAGVRSKTVVRTKKRFNWDDDPTKLAASYERLTNYHARFRTHVVPIIAPPNHWYLRRKGAQGEQLPLLAVTFAALHLLSELSRYQPTMLRKHLDGSEGWLLTEFLQIAPAQFITTVASEITGYEFIRPDAVRI